MKQDPDYAKKLLQAIEDWPEPYITGEDLLDQGFKDPKILEHHIRLLRDRGYIEADEKSDLTVIIAASSPHRAIIVCQMRITADGHDFAAKMRNDTIFSKFKPLVQEFGWQAAQITSAVIDQAHRLG